MLFSNIAFFRDLVAAYKLTESSLTDWTYAHWLLKTALTLPLVHSVNAQQELWSIGATF